MTRWYFPKQTEIYKVSVPLYRWLRREVHQFDLVHVHAVFSFPSVAAAWAARRAGIPYVVRPLGVLNYYGMTKRRSVLKRISVATIEGPILRDAAAVHFTSQQEQKEAEALNWPFRSVIIPHGLEPIESPTNELFLSLHPMIRDRRRILFLSRLDRKKNVECLLEAFARVRNECADLILIICGDGKAEYIAHLRNLAQTLGLSDAVLWAGNVEGKVKQSALASAELFILPSFSENFGIAAAEALFAGLPCVLSKGVAIAAEVACAGAGVAVEPTPEAVAESIRFFVNDPLRRTLAGSCPGDWPTPSIQLRLWVRPWCDFITTYSSKKSSEVFWSWVSRGLISPRTAKCESGLGENNLADSFGRRPALVSL